MADFKVIESFDIDNASLDGLSRQQCFVLGAEWARFRFRILAGEQFSTLCNVANAERLCALAERHARFVEYHEHCPGWCQIFVGASRSSPDAD